MGLPCPNIFAGEHAFHSRLEWVSRQDMEKAVQTIVHLAMIWEEKRLRRLRAKGGPALDGGGPVRVRRQP